MRTLSNLHDAHPWPKDWLAMGKPLEYFFHIDIPYDKDALWPILTDTSRINKGMGLTEIKFYEEHGRKMGTCEILWMTQLWYEAPWEWIYGDYVSAVRIYSKGQAHIMRAIYTVEETENGSCRVYIYFGWIPRNPFHRLVLQLYRSTFRKNFIMSLNNILKETNQAFQAITTPIIVPGINVPVSTTTGITNEKRIKAINDRVISKGLISPEDMNSFMNFLNTASVSDLSRLRPKVISRKISMEMEILLPLMMHLTREGMLVINWEVLCPNCRGVKEHMHHIWDTIGKGECDKCDIDFSKAGYDMLEIAFYINPEIRDIREAMFCSAEPSKKPSIVVQKKVKAGESFTLHLNFDPGRYRLIRMDRLESGYLDIEKNLKSGDITWISSEHPMNLAAGPGSFLHIHNDNSDDIYYAIQKNNIDDDVLRPADIFNFQEFRDLFPDEHIAEGLSIDVGIQNILFVDVVGSTEIYTSLGNTRAFYAIRDFYKIARGIALKYKGTIVKTIGDAVMMSFRDPLLAMKAGFRFAGEPVHLGEGRYMYTRVSLNRGPCLAVNMDTAIDYFGNPVNIAAKLQGFTNEGEISFTDEFVNEYTVREYLEMKGFSFKTPRKGFIKGAGDVNYWKIKVKKI